MQKFKTVDELVHQLKPSEPVYCIRKQSIQTASNIFKKNFLEKFCMLLKLILIQRF